MADSWLLFDHKIKLLRKKINQKEMELDKLNGELKNIIKKLLMTQQEKMQK